MLVEMTFYCLDERAKKRLGPGPLEFWARLLRYTS